jgi:hypothetical protein
MPRSPLTAATQLLFAAAAAVGCGGGQLPTPGADLMAATTVGKYR